MLSHDFHLLFYPFINQCDQVCGVLSLGMLFGVKENHYNILQYIID